MQPVLSPNRVPVDEAVRYRIDDLIVRFRNAPGRADELHCLNELFHEIRDGFLFVGRPEVPIAGVKSELCRQKMLDEFIQKVQLRLKGRVGQDELADQLHRLLVLGPPGCRQRRLE